MASTSTSTSISGSTNPPGTTIKVAATPMSGSSLLPPKLSRSASPTSKQSSEFYVKSANTTERPIKDATKSYTNKHPDSHNIRPLASKLLDSFDTAIHCELSLLLCILREVNVATVLLIEFSAFVALHFHRCRAGHDDEGTFSNTAVVAESLLERVGCCKECLFVVHADVKVLGNLGSWVLGSIGWGCTSI